MYAVIFRAQIAQLDERYFTTAERLRDLALSDYGCLDFIANTQGEQELAISYWPSLAHIQRWQQNPEHLAAQALGKARWYQSHHVQVVEVLRSYSAIK
jgi:arginine utilization protein RocB